MKSTLYQPKELEGICRKSINAANTTMIKIDKIVHDMTERIKELSCLYGLSQLVEQNDNSLDCIFQGLVDLVAKSWQYPKITCARVIFEGAEFKTDNFRQTPWVQSADICTGNKKSGVVEVYYLQECPQSDEGPFLEEERKLLDALVERLGRIAERKAAEEKVREYQQRLRYLAADLTKSEEDTRRRIAVELHDNIGHNLAITKMKTETLCEKLMNTEHSDSMNEIVDSIIKSMKDVSSFTFELSPAILYESGLEAAIEWFAGRFEQQFSITCQFSGDGQAKALSNDLQILLFRCVRELLINVGKHAQATTVSIIAEKDSTVYKVVVEDDGVGFGPSLVTMKTKSGNSRGFGLFSITERINYQGGSIEIDSGPQRKGTKIILAIPMQK